MRTHKITATRSPANLQSGETSQMSQMRPGDAGAPPSASIGPPPVSASAKSTPPRTAFGLFQSVTSYLFGTPTPLPEPPPSRLVWPTGKRLSRDARPEDCVGRLQRGGLPPSLQQPHVAGYRGDVGSDGNITHSELFVAGENGQLLRLPMQEHLHSTTLAAQQVEAFTATQRDAPRLGGYERLTGSDDIIFRVGQHCVKPALSAPACANALAVGVGTKPVAPRTKRDRMRWEAFPLGNGHFLVPTVGHPDATTEPHGSRSACVAAMAVMKGVPIHEISERLRRGECVIRDAAATIGSFFNASPEAVKGKTTSDAEFGRLVNSLQHQLRAHGAATMVSGDHCFMLYDIRQEPGSDEGLALVGDPRTATLHEVSFGPGRRHLLPPGYTSDGNVQAFFVSKGSFNFFYPGEARLRTLEYLSSPEQQSFEAFVAKGHQQELAALCELPRDFTYFCESMKEHLFSERARGEVRGEFLRNFKAGLDTVKSYDGDTVSKWASIIGKVASQFVHGDGGKLEELGLDAASKKLLDRIQLLYEEAQRPDYVPEIVLPSMQRRRNNGPRSGG